MLPIPSCPNSFSPQQYARPSGVRAHPCLAPRLTTSKCCSVATLEGMHERRASTPLAGQFSGENEGERKSDPSHDSHD